MKGYPKYLNTKEDYLYVIKNFPKEVWRDDVQGLLDTMREWMNVKYLDNPSDGKVDDLHKVVEIATEDGSIKYIQCVLRVNPRCKLYRLGFTEKQIKSFLN